MSTAPPANRILLTGGTGFIGARVLRRLLGQGREVAVLLRKSGDTRRIADLLGQCHRIAGDLSELAASSDAIAAFQPEAVLHLGWGGVKASDRDSEVQLLNVSAALDLYRITAQAGCTHFVGLGSQAEYGLLAGRIREDAATHPTTLYGTAKLATGQLLQRASQVSGRTCVWLRLFAAYGPDDNRDWLVPYLIRQLLDARKPSLTPAEQVWDYLHVDDAANAVIAAMQSGVCGTFNLGSGQGRPLRDIVTLVRDAIDPALPLGFGEVAYRSDQVMHLESDITALCAATGWAPSVRLDDGIAATVDWYKRRARHDH